MTLSPSVWTVGTVTLQQGSSTPFNVAATGPLNGVPGGIYRVSPTSPALPSGMQLSEAGSLGVGSAAPTTAFGVTFSYYEPGALPTLTLNGTGTNVPYMATVYPLEGTVPNGQELGSVDDPNLRCSILSRWPDNSASVVVLAGNTSPTGTKPIALRPVAPQGGGALTTATINAAINRIDFNNFTGTVQTLLMSSATPDWTWWANPQVICARYRKSLGLGQMEAVIDIHAFVGGRAFVEVVIENCAMDSSLTNPVDPGSQSYTNATVVLTPVVGSPVTLATVSSSGCPNSAIHQAFRAWYCSGWAGGDPAITVTHDTASMQAHPMFWRAARQMVVDYATNTFSGQADWQGTAQTYAADAYTPWKTGRHIRAGMAGTGEDTRGSIGPFTGWDSDYICSGNRHAANAVIQSALALHTFNVNYRDSLTHQVPHPGLLQNHKQGTNWPAISYSTGSSNANFERAHQPASPLVAFLCRPSPCFIELAQKILAWNHTDGYNTGAHTSDQPRGRAWCMRNYGIGVFLTPNTHASFSTWITEGRALLMRQLAKTDAFRTDAKNKLDIVWENNPTDVSDLESTVTGVQNSLWENAWMVSAFNTVAQMKALRGTDQSTFDAVADWLARFPVRYINECANGEWRGASSYRNTIGYFTVAPAYAQTADTWGATLNDWNTDAPPSESGPWFKLDITARAWAARVDQTAPADITYAARFWHALCVAKERGVGGADAAYARVYGTAENGSITGMTTWMNGFATYPIYNRVAR
jgi:hypothetical protein